MRMTDAERRTLRAMIIKCEHAFYAYKTTSTAHEEHVFAREDMLVSYVEDLLAARRTPADTGDERSFNGPYGG